MKSIGEGSTLNRLLQKKIEIFGGEGRDVKRFFFLNSKNPNQTHFLKVIKPPNEWKEKYF